VYGSFPYWLSSCAPYIPQCLAATLSYSSIVYYMTGLNPGIGEPPMPMPIHLPPPMPDPRAGLRLYVCVRVCTTERFGYFAVVVMFCSLCGLYFCQLVSLLVPSPQISVSIFPAALFVIVAFAGFVVRLPYLPDFLSSWAPTLSFARWAFQGLVINEFQGNGKINYASIVTKDKLEKIMRIPNAKLNPYEVCSTRGAWRGLGSG
jgi:hypothetical protein